MAAKKDANGKIRLAVIYGGDSTERDISVITAIQAMKNLSGRYEIFPVLLVDGAFHTLRDADNVKTYIGGVKRKKRVYIEKEGIFVKGVFGMKKVFVPDCCLLCTHGGSGENGGLQGLLDVADIPYTSAGVSASAIGMDKALSKTLFNALGLKVTPYVLVNEDEKDAAERAEREIGFPVIVKPVSQGSSIGITVAKDKEQLREALGTAFFFDDRVLCERALTDFTELNCAVLVRDGRTLASELERPVGWEEFLTFEKKYLSGGGKMSGGGRIYPADVSEKVREEVRSAAIAAYEGTGMKGVVRIDFLLDNKTGDVYINEANTIPGSLATYLFEKNGMGFADVVDCVVSDAISRSKRRKNAKFGSNVLDIYGKSSANACKMHGKIL